MGGSKWGQTNKTKHNQYWRQRLTNETDIVAWGCWTELYIKWRLFISCLFLLLTLVAVLQEMASSVGTLGALSVMGQYLDVVLMLPEVMFLPPPPPPPPAPLSQKTQQGDLLHSTEYSIKKFHELIEHRLQ